MREQEEERGFTVSDRRGHAAESARESAPPPRSAPPKEDPAPPDQAAHEPIDFSGFLFSLASTAMMHLGEPMPDGRTAPLSLPHAQEMIDLLALLETKTRGNLTSDESALLANLLYTLRLRYVEKAR